MRPYTTEQIMKTITGKTVLLTGASGGIGAYIARALAKEQATVVCVSRSPEALERIRLEIEAMGGKGISIPFDLANVEELSILAEKIDRVAGSVNIIINNAAIEKFRPFQNYSLEDIQSILTLNLHAPMELTRLLLPQMLKSNSGHIVNISSGAGKKGAPFNSIYSASKAGLIMWSEALRHELANTDVGVSTICPGCTNAGMFLDLDIPAPKGARIAEPAEVADTIVRAIKHNHKEVVLDGLTLKVFYAISQLSPEFGDSIIQKAGVVETNRDCAYKKMQAESVGRSNFQLNNR
ncbi:MAG: SDR family NAD(P)-dependent oxidoreductase [Hydrococcus sp. Prado102]|jgi:short-subunit dehydrogenase|nr:SDR family NAD(P)-dependent oxidoreductase [Hydrococcus sp. Prado102]